MCCRYDQEDDAPKKDLSQEFKQKRDTDMLAFAMAMGGGVSHDDDMDASVHEVVLDKEDLKQFDDDFSDLGDLDTTVGDEGLDHDRLSFAGSHGNHQKQSPSPRIENLEVPSMEMARRDHPTDQASLQSELCPLIFSAGLTVDSVAFFVDGGVPQSWFQDQYQMDSMYFKQPRYSMPTAAVSSESGFADRSSAGYSTGSPITTFDRSPRSSDIFGLCFSPALIACHSKCHNVLLRIL